MISNFSKFFTIQAFPKPHIPDDETTVYLYDNQLICNCEMYDVHDFVNNELSTQYQLEGITQLCFRPM